MRGDRKQRESAKVCSEVLSKIRMFCSKNSIQISIAIEEGMLIAMSKTNKELLISNSKKAEDSVKKMREVNKKSK